MKKEKIMGLEEVENIDGAMVLDVPDDVYVSSSGKYYYPEATTKAKIKMDLQTAEDKGYKPSKVYLKFLETLAEKQK